jgi:hypothetical protein
MGPTTRREEPRCARGCQLPVARTESGKLTRATESTVPNADETVRIDARGSREVTPTTPRLEPDTLRVAAFVLQSR